MGVLLYDWRIGGHFDCSSGDEGGGECGAEGGGECDVEVSWWYDWF